jgi:hypothetical protein
MSARQGFAVTYETVTEESAQHGDAAERGFLEQGMTLREALKMFNDERDWTMVEADCYPLSPASPPRWFRDSGEIQFASGDCREVALHLPDDITGHSAMRIARLVGCYGATA